MKGVIGFGKALYRSNKLLFVLALVAVAVFIVGCSAQGQSYPPPSGPVGGGCGF